MSLPELLQQWTEVGDETIGYDYEPGHGKVEVLVSRVTPPGLSDQWHVTHGRERFGGTPGDPAFDAHVLAAVIEAIRARGKDGREANAHEEGYELHHEWRWHVSGDSTITRGLVWRGCPGTVGTYYEAACASPAEALLAAYLKAVQHQETGE